jgi:hypothetical protein
MFCPSQWVARDRIQQVLSANGSVLSESAASAVVQKVGCSVPVLFWYNPLSAALSNSHDANDFVSHKSSLTKLLPGVKEVSD